MEQPKYWYFLVWLILQSCKIKLRSSQSDALINLATMQSCTPEPSCSTVLITSSIHSTLPITSLVCSTECFQYVFGQQCRQLPVSGRQCRQLSVSGPQWRVCFQYLHGPQCRYLVCSANWLQYLTQILETVGAAERIKGLNTKWLLIFNSLGLQQEVLCYSSCRESKRFSLKIGLCLLSSLPVFSRAPMVHLEYLTSIQN